jgi:predicted phosphoribosyltransferase
MQGRSCLAQEAAQMRFRDRTDAGRQLAQALAAKYRGRAGVVYALPRGGVPLGAEIARALDMPLDLMIARKIGHPYNREYAIGAVTATGEPVVNPHEMARIDPGWFARAVEAEREEARRRHQAYSGGRALLPAQGKVAIIVDDGIATGLTMEAAIRATRALQPAQLVVAVPVVPADTAARLARTADEVVALKVDEDYLGAVGAYYDYFPQTTDDEVIELLRSVAGGQAAN